MDIWQSIETAPKDGTRILLLHEVRLFRNFRIGYTAETMQIIEGWFVDGNWEVWQGHRTRCTNKLNPTHWMLKPLPPTVSKELLLQIEAEFVQRMVSLGWTPPPTP